jgi:hypothetical protein
MARKVLIVFFALGLAAAFAQTASKVQVATGNIALLAPVNPGTWNCENGGLTGTFPPCGPTTTRVLVRDISNKYIQTNVVGSAAALVGGVNTTTVNGNFDPSLYGHMWGGFNWEVPDMGGRWEGSFTAMADQMKGIVILRAVGYGYGGKLEGLKLEFFQENPGGGLPPTFIAIVTPK